MADSQSPLAVSVVFVPNIRVDRGMGHLRRCLAAAASAGQQAAVYFAADAEFTGGRPIFERSVVQNMAAAAGVTLLDRWPQGPAPVVVADLQECGLAAFRFLSSRAVSLIGWDAGGKARSRFPYLIDSLPHDTKPSPNLRLPGLLGLSPPSSDRFDRSIKKVLAVFGGADPAGLTPRFLSMVRRLQNSGRWTYTLTVIRGPLSNLPSFPGVGVVDAPSDLLRLLREADLVVTSWGLTALESLSVGTPVLLFNPTPYHQKLAKKAGLPSFGVKHPSSKKFLSGVLRAPAAARTAAGKFLEPPVEAGRYFAGFQGSDGVCPVCRTQGHPVFARTVHKSYHRCRVCGMEYLSVHQLPPKVYSQAYFFEDYQKQYGKTYLDDFDHIRGVGSQRLAYLEAHCGKREHRRILDVGCAYGPVLAAAARSGHLPFGLDIAQDAVRHVCETLKFPAASASFLDFSWEQAFPGEAYPDTVTLWYVIEHFPDLDAVLRKASGLLPQGGILAFSTPNGRGITRRFKPSKFWRESPDDHFSIWNPRNASRVLGRFGFKVKAVRITGRHPERFPGLKKPSGFLYSVIAVLDRCFGWGDTFEVYARKVKELP